MLKSYTSRHCSHTHFPCYTYDRWAIAYSWSSWGNLWTYYTIIFPDSAVCLSMSQRHGASWRWGWRNGLQTWRVAANVLTKQPWTEVKWLSRHSGPFGRGDRYRCDYNRLVQRFPFHSSWSAAYKTGGLGLGFEGNRLGKGILLGCTQSFTVGRQLFKEVTVISGVPQGSV